MPSCTELPRYGFNFALVESTTDGIEIDFHESRYSIFDNHKNYDPRAKIIKQMPYEVFEVTGKDPKLDIALELERIALEDKYFVKRKLYPNVDFYSGLIYKAMKFPVEMFPVLFAIPRMSGWLAQWQELLTDPEQKIARPRQLYLGYQHRDLKR